MKRQTFGIGSRLAAATLAFALSGLAAADAVGETGATPAHDLLLEIHLEKDRAYLGESIAATVTFLAGQVSVRNVRYPRLEGNAYRISEFAAPKLLNVTRDGRSYATYAFTATLKPLGSGRLQLGPAELSADIVEQAAGAAAFFGGGEPRQITVRSAPVTLAVLPLPQATQPADFAGAVGRFRVSRQAEPTAVRTGDAITVTTRIEGTGNADGFSCAPVVLPHVRAYPTRARRTPSTLTCTQVLVPERQGELSIPAAAISYFDPHGGRYRSERSHPPRVRVTDGEAPPLATAAPASPPVTAPGEARKGAEYWYLAPPAAALLLGLAIHMRRHTRKRLRTPPAETVPDKGLAEHLADAKDALAAQAPARFHTAVYRALQAHLSARYSLPADAITGDVVTRILRPAGVQGPLSQDYEKLFRICDEARYSPDGARAAPMQDTVRLLERVVQADSPAKTDFRSGVEGSASR